MNLTNQQMPLTFFLSFFPVPPAAREAAGLADSFSSTGVAEPAAAPLSSSPSFCSQGSSTFSPVTPRLPQGAASSTRLDSLALERRNGREIVDTAHGNSPRFKTLIFHAKLNSGVLFLPLSFWVPRIPSRAGKTEKTRLAWVPVRSHLLGLGIVLLGGSGGGHGGGALPPQVIFSTGLKSSASGLVFFSSVSRSFLVSSGLDSAETGSFCDQQSRMISVLDG